MRQHDETFLEVEKLKSLIKIFFQLMKKLEIFEVEKHLREDIAA